VRSGVDVTTRVRWFSRLATVRRRSFVRAGRFGSGCMSRLLIGRRVRPFTRPSGVALGRRLMALVRRIVAVVIDRRRAGFRWRLAGFVRACGTW
jgi:hypothetical protein